MNTPAQTGSLEMVCQTTGQKFVNDQANDYKQWEQYDILTLEGGLKKELQNIASVHIPNYIKPDLKLTPNQMIEVKQISDMKCGQKIGRKISDPDAKWCEKWFEIKCIDEQKTKFSS